MNRTNIHNNLKKISAGRRLDRRLIYASILLLVLTLTVFYNLQTTSAQIQVKVQPPLAPTAFRVGERLTYNVSFERFNNAAYAEIYTVSRGKLGERDAVELRSKIKTNELVSAFYLIDETRTTYAASDSALPIYTRKISNAGVTPKEAVGNFTVNPTAYNDLLTLIFQARTAGGAGNFSFQEDESTLR